MALSESETIKKPIGMTIVHHGVAMHLSDSRRTARASDSKHCSANKTAPPRPRPSITSIHPLWAVGTGQSNIRRTLMAGPSGSSQKAPYP
jgi:hypothetical protein